MSRSHNKKRNIGIIYELLLRSISSSLIANEKDRAEKALKIIENRFDKSTEVYKEFRLFNALANSSVSDSSVVAAILTEARQACERCNVEKLDKEKSILIRDINYNLKDENFYFRRIPEYKSYATIQTLLNDWRSKDKAPLTRIVEYQSKVAERLLSNSPDKKDISEEKNENINSLVVKIMTEKLNKKYHKKFSKSQREILTEYVFSISENSDQNIRTKLKEIRDNINIEMTALYKSTENKIILEKIEKVTEKINSIKIEKIDDLVISKFLTLTDLRKEINEEIK